jgi:hypothetical protein
VVAKVVFVIICGAGVASGVLSMRQQRIQAASDMVRAISRAEEHDRTLWAVRGDIARVTTPEQVMVLASALGPMLPIPREFCEPDTATADARPTPGASPKPAPSPSGTPPRQARVLRTANQEARSAR